MDWKTDYRIVAVYYRPITETYSSLYTANRKPNKAGGKTGNHTTEVVCKEGKRNLVEGGELVTE